MPGENGKQEQKTLYQSLGGYDVMAAIIDDLLRVCSRILGSFVLASKTESDGPAHLVSLRVHRSAMQVELRLQ
jgi:hypothetical protein